VIEPNTIICGDCLTVMREWPDQCVQTCVTSPPYWGLRDYGVDGQIGLEQTPEQYVARLVDVFREVRRVLRDDGTLWLNLGDSFAKAGESGLGLHGESSTTGKPNPYATIKKQIPGNLKPKDLIGIPWRVAFALQADGWYMRSDIIWSKPNPMPESVTDRPTKAHEYIFLMSKNARYYYDAEAIKEPAHNWGTRDRSNFRGGTEDPLLKHYGLQGSDEDGQTRNRRSVWTVATQPFSGSHFATFPPKLIEPCILAGCPEDGIVLDPFAGSGTTVLTALRLHRNAVGIELNREYCTLRQGEIDAELAQTRLDL